MSAQSVLIVDDTPDDVSVLEQVLNHHGIQALTASSAAECIHILERSSPGLVIVDLKMPDVDGWQLLEQIRAGGWKMPVLAMTAYDSPAVAEHAGQSGFTGYYPKPILPSQFVAELQALLS